MKNRDEETFLNDVEKDLYSNDFRKSQNKLNEKYDENIKALDINEKNILEILMNSTSKVIENHIIFLLNDDDKIDYIEKFIETIEKVRIRTFYKLLSD